MAVVQESLERWTQHLRSYDITRNLWNEIGKKEWEPKDENHLRDNLQAWLKVDLAARKLVLGREVEVSRSNSPVGEAGMRLDLLVDAVLSTPLHDGNDRISVVVEVKGSWNKDAAESLTSQLAERYLNGRGFAGGLYVVGWFSAHAWNDGDYRKKTGSWKSVEEARTDLMSRMNLFKVGRPVLALRTSVLDCSLL